MAVLNALLAAATRQSLEKRFYSLYRLITFDLIHYNSKRATFDRVSLPMRCCSFLLLIATIAKQN